MRIAVAADHAGVSLRNALVSFLAGEGHEPIVLGREINGPGDDYPIFAKLVGSAIAGGRAERGVLICGSGAGVTVAANKLPGIRAALASDDYTARQMVEHDFCNVLTLGARTVRAESARSLVKGFVDATFLAEERHRRRLAEVLQLEWDQHPSPLKDLHDAGQSIWLDNMARSLVTSGTLTRYISQFAVTGLTSNPTIFEHAIAGSEDYDRSIADLLDEGLDTEQLFFRLAIEDIVAAADLFRPIYEATGGHDGFVSLEVSPTLADDSTATIAEARRLYELADRPNLYIKVPGTRAGVVAIEELIAGGVSINVTLLFSREQVLAAADAYLRGLERRVAAGQTLEVSSVASLFVSRWDVASAPHLPADLKNRVGIAVAHQAYAAYRDVLESNRWKQLAAAAARPQRLLFGSTGTKDPTLPDTYYVGALASADTINTMPETTLLAFGEHGTLGGLLLRDAGDAESVLAAAGKAGLDLSAWAARLQIEGRDAFDSSFARLLQAIEAKVRKLRADSARG